jgi:hypothetical protein
MITLKDINTAIVNQVTNGLANTAYNTLKFSSTDIKEQVTRPSFFLEFDSNKTGSFNANNKERTLSAKIYYFPSDVSKYKIENMEIQGYLEDIFLKYLVINDTFYININELDFSIITGILICTMELYTLEDISDEVFADTVQSTANDNTENMEDLEIN